MITTQPVLCFETRHIPSGEVICRQSSPVVVTVSGVELLAIWKQVAGADAVFECVESGV